MESDKAWGAYQLYLNLGRAGILREACAANASRTKAQEEADAWSKAQCQNTFMTEVDPGWLELQDFGSLGRCLGKGAFGVVFALEDEEEAEATAVKLVADHPWRPPISEEYKLHRLFEKQNLALPVFACSSQETCWGRVSSLKMKRFDLTLEKYLQRISEVSQSKAPEWQSDLALKLGLSLAMLLWQARSANLAHNDAKSNNVAVVTRNLEDDASPKIFFLDFGHALSLSSLKKRRGLTTEDASEVLDVALCLDAHRLISSLKRHLQRRFPKNQEAWRPLWATVACLPAQQFPNIWGRELFPENEQAAHQDLKNLLSKKLRRGSSTKQAWL